MQRIPLFSIALLSTVVVSNAALAGPLFLDPQPQRTPIASIFGAPPPAEPVAPPVRQVAAQGEYGGGFFGMRFRRPVAAVFWERVCGGRGGAAAPAPATSRAYPADLGPGMVEFADQPGQAVVDPR